jgi:hypothetical protein
MIAHRPIDQTTTSFSPTAPCQRMNSSAVSSIEPISAAHAAFAKACRCPRSRDRVRQSSSASGPCPASAPKSSEAGMGEEAATPGLPVRARARHWTFPRQFTLENRRLPLALPRSFGRFRNHVFRCNPLCGTLLRPATKNSYSFVQKLWTFALPCGNLWKSCDELRA